MTNETVVKECCESASDNADHHVHNNCGDSQSIPQLTDGLLRSEVESYHTDKEDE